MLGDDSGAPGAQSCRHAPARCYPGALVVHYAQGCEKAGCAPIPAIRKIMQRAELSETPVLSLCHLGIDDHQVSGSDSRSTSHTFTRQLPLHIPFE